MEFVKHVLLWLTVFGLMIVRNCDSSVSPTELSDTSKLISKIFDVPAEQKNYAQPGKLIREGKLKLSSSHTNAEVLFLVGVGLVIGFILVCVPMGCKYCWCPTKLPTVIMYQRMPSTGTPDQAQQPQPPQPYSVVTSGSGIINMKNLDATNSSRSPTPPPPYPGCDA